MPPWLPWAVLSAFFAGITAILAKKGVEKIDSNLATDPRATAPEIKAAVEELFKVSVVKVNTMNVRGKVRRQFTKAAGRTSDWKKAIVTLKKGDKISLN